MEITIFAKKKKSLEGKEFKVYSTKLVNKATGEETFFNVKFRESCGTPKNCPCTIEAAKEDCNISEDRYEVINDETGETMVNTTKVLWVTNWSNEQKYVDHSTDEYF